MENCFSKMEKRFKMKFRYPTDKEFEMAGRLYYFEHTHFFNVNPLHRELIKDTNKFPAWIKAHACDDFVTEDGQGICCLTPNIDGSKYVYAIWVNQAFGDSATDTKCWNTQRRYRLKA